MTEEIFIAITPLKLPLPKYGKSFNLQTIEDIPMYQQLIITRGFYNFQINLQKINLYFLIRSEGGGGHLA